MMLLGRRLKLFHKLCLGGEEHGAELGAEPVVCLVRRTNEEIKALEADGRGADDNDDDDDGEVSDASSITVSLSPRPKRPRKTRLIDD